LLSGCTENDNEADKSTSTYTTLNELKRFYEGQYDVVQVEYFITKNLRGLIIYYNSTEVEYLDWFHNLSDNGKYRCLIDFYDDMDVFNLKYTGICHIRHAYIDKKYENSGGVV